MIWMNSNLVQVRLDFVFCRRRQSLSVVFDELIKQLCMDMTMAVAAAAAKAG